MQEADDFFRLRTSLELATSLHTAIQAHQTPVLKSAATTTMTAMQALQAYHVYARAQFHVAGGTESNAADALYGLARLQPPLATAGGKSDETAVGARVMTLLQAALAISPQHAESLNELGVVFARYNRLDEANSMFVRALDVRQTPETWHNLATVLERQGRTQDAAQARARAEQALQGRNTLVLVGGDDSLPQVRWVDPAEFSAMEPPLWQNEFTAPAGTTPAPAASTPVRKTEEDSKGLFNAFKQKFASRKP